METLYSDIRKKYKTIDYVLTCYINKLQYEKQEDKNVIIENLKKDKNLACIMYNIERKGITYLLNLLKYCEMYLDKTHATIIQMDFILTLENHCAEVSSWINQAENSLNNYCLEPYNYPSKKDYYII